MKALAIVALLATSAHADEHLPRSLKPYGYRVQLSLDATKVVTGHIEISGIIESPASAIWLDAEHLVVSSARAHGPVDVPLEIKSVDGKLSLIPSTPLREGDWTIELDYTAAIADDGVALLPPDGAPRDPIPEQLAAANTVAAGVFRQTVDGAAYTFTQSEPMDARRIFPCIDEPDLKVPWLLTLDVDDGLVAAANAPIARETPLPNHRKRVAFAQTQPLPSYLVAFAVGPFDVIDAGVATSGTHLRILETHGHTAPWAAATAARVLDLTAAWTGIPYAYEKLDLVAVPRTGAHWAAMENPGLVTFADWVIRPDEKSREQKERWVAIAAHEFAHQWFGDLVTTAWWNDIWLNESFAVWVAREITTQFDPAYATTAEKAYPDFVEIARPVPGGTNYLDYFAGGRGARALAMFNELLGPAKFQGAIHAYLVRHAHGNATTADLADALSAAYGAPLEPALLAAIDRPSIPDVAVRASCDRGSPPGGSGAEGRRGLIDVTASEPTPVCVAYEDRGKRATTCALVAKTASFPLAACPRWLVPNADAAMRYTTHRTPTELAQASFGWSLLSPPERAALLEETGPDLALALRLVDAPGARTWAAQTIAKAARLSPVPVAPWLRAHYLARAKQLDLASGDRDDAAVLDAIAEAGDPDLGARPAELVSEALQGDPHRPCSRR